MTQACKTQNVNLNESDQLVIRYDKEKKPTGESSIRRYIQGKLLGRGGFARVYKFTCMDTDEVYAGKILTKKSLKDPVHMQKFKAEIKLHKSLDHPNILKFHRYFEDDENVYILLELCSNKNLSQLLTKRKTLTELEVQCYISQVVQALHIIHERQILHRDLKLANLLLNDKMQLKVADFGLAAKLSSEKEKRKTICGTPAFMAPEVIDNSKGYSYPADIWSLGVICFNLLTGKLPFNGITSKEVYQKVREGKFTFPSSVTLSFFAKDIITKMLTFEPENRITLAQIQKHPFLNPKGGIPPALPVSALVAPLPSSFVKQYEGVADPPKLGALFRKVEASKERSQSAKSRDMEPLRFNMLTNGEKEMAKGMMTSPRKRIMEKLDSSTDNAMLETKRSFWKESGKKSKEEDELLDKEERMANIWDFNTPQKREHQIEPKFRFTFKREDEKKSEEKVTPEHKKHKERKREKVDTCAKMWPLVRVSYWADYSNTYGLGYTLSDGSVGVLFSDATKMLMEPEGRYFYYIVVGVGKKENHIKSPWQQYPPELEEKVTDLKRFDSYFEKRGQKAAPKMQSDSNGILYVRKWLKTKHSALFRMNTGELHVVFVDDSTLTMCPYGKKVKYMSKEGDLKAYNLETDSLNNDKDVKKRVIYTMEVLKKVWSKKNEEEALKRGEKPEINLKVSSKKQKVK